MAECAFLEPSFDENTDWPAIIDRWRHFAQPDILIGIPTSDLSGQRIGSPMGHPFGDYLIASPQQPFEVLITARPAIYAPNSALALFSG